MKPRNALVSILALACLSHASSANAQCNETLDDAYNCPGAGLGNTIDTTAGGTPVILKGKNGLRVESTQTIGALTTYPRPLTITGDCSGGGTGGGGGSNPGGLNPSGPDQVLIAGGTDDTYALALGYNTTYHYGALQSQHGLGYTPLYLNTHGGLVSIGSSTSFVGIGTLNPTKTLTVAGTILSTAGTIQSSDIGFTFPDNTIQRTAATFLWLSNGANIYNSNPGNVGIGVSDPGEKLVVSGGIVVDAADLNPGTTANSFRFGGASSGEAIASKQTAGGNQHGLDFYTGSINRMAIDLNGNVGVGTTAPGDRFVVNGGVVVDNGHANLATVASSLRFGGSGSGEAIASNRDPANSPTTPNKYGLDFYTGSINRMAISLTGNIGIGTPTPGARLDIAGGDVHLDSANREILFGDNGQIRSHDDNHRLLFSRSQNKLELREYGDVVLSAGAVQGAETDSLVVRSGGNVGIGTYSPGEKLTVNGGVIVDNGAANNGTTASSLRFGGPGLSGEAIGSNRDPNDMAHHYGLDFYTSSANRMVITNIGDVGIGTRSPTSRLDVAGTASAQEFKTSLGNTAGRIVGQYMDSNPWPSDLVLSTNVDPLSGAVDHALYGTSLVRLGSAQGGTAGSISFATGTVDSPPQTRMSIDSAGNVGIGTTTPAQPLDVNGTARVRVLEIIGADLAERFELSESAEPGTVVAIDKSHPGKLCVARGAYNKCVAGVVSGANNLNAGVVLAKDAEAHNTHQHAIALSGRVWVKSDATHGAIEPGDMLTTSGTPGHATKAVNPQRSTGAVLGKAMTRLDKGTGLVLVLVNLQ